MVGGFAAGVSLVEGAWFGFEGFAFEGGGEAVALFHVGKGSPPAGFDLGLAGDAAGPTRD